MSTICTQITTAAETLLTMRAATSAAETLLTMRNAPVALQSGLRTPNDKELRRGLPSTFNVRDIVRPNGRKDKEFFSPTGQKFRSIKQAVISSS